LRKIVTGVGSLLLALLVAYIAFNIDAHLFRKRAEHLKAEVERLSMEGGTLADAKKLARMYDYSELRPCSFTICVYQIEVANTPWRLVFNRHFNFVGRAMMGAGYMPSRAIAYVSARNGKVTAASYRIYTGRSDHSTLITGTDSRNALEAFYSASEAAESHPDLYVHQPGGCTFCEALYADVVPGAREDDRRAAYHYDLSCMTKLGGCKDFQELVPDIAHIRERQYRDDQKPASRCDAFTIERFARDFGTVLLVAARSKQKTDPNLKVSAVVKEVLKATNKGSIPEGLVLDVFPHATPHYEIKPGSAWLAFFPTDRLQPSVLVPEIGFKCALVPAESDLVSAARRSIQRNPMERDYFGYMP
jgi:hypothetical protein